MKKIYVLFSQKKLDIVSTILNRYNIDYELYSIDEYMNNSNLPYNIIINDIKTISDDYFWAKIFQSFEENIETRLLIPNEFYSKDIWGKEYTLIHELGHYFSLENKLVFEYQKIFESNYSILETMLWTELYTIPLEIEAERFVSINRFELFEKNIEEVYLNYYEQIKEILDKLNNSNIWMNFEKCFVIRLYRFSLIVNKILDKDSDLYKECYKQIENIKELFETKGDLFKKYNNYEQLIINKVWNNDEYLSLCNDILINVKKDKRQWKQ